MGEWTGNPDALCERIDIMTGDAAYQMTPATRALLTEAAACIREMVEQRDAARSVIKDTCDKAAWMEGAASDSMTIETVAVLASQCRAYQHLASLPPAPGAEA